MILASPDDRLPALGCGCTKSRLFNMHQPSHSREAMKEQKHKISGVLAVYLLREAR